MSVFDKIAKNRLNSGVKKPKTPKPVEALREVVQGFRISSDKNVLLNDGLKNPVTKLSMSIAESNTDLRGASNTSKSKSCNSTLNKANANVYVWPKFACRESE